MTTTVQAVYEEGVLKLRHRLPLAPLSEVSVTVEMPDVAASSSTDFVVWPDVAARLQALYGATVLRENAVMTARDEERF
jgi:predicted DNA-binding antitoxin AbrB/MazE fold protein